MDKIVTENLFLLEFLVDNIDLDKKCECDSPPGETCVSFQFLDNGPLDVCEADFNPKRNMTGDSESSVKSGKSCLFSLSPEQATAATEQFDICVSVMKKMQPGWLPEKVEVGASVIGIAELFNELINSVELSDGSCPTAKTVKDVFDINDAQGTVIGKISVYIRMSCFGKLIVTQFQMNLDDKSVLFKDKEGKSLYRYKKAGKKRNGDGSNGKARGNDVQGYNAGCPQTPCATSNLQPPGCPQTPCDTSNLQPPAPPSGGYQCPVSPACAGSPPQAAMNNVPPMGNGYPGGYSAGLGTQTAMTPCNECGFLPQPACLPPMGNTGGPTMTGGYTEVPMPPQAPPEGNYQEIGASMGGNSLTIRVHKDRGQAEQVDPNGMGECVCSAGGTPSTQGYGTGGSKQQAFAMRPGATPNSPFSFKLGQVGASGQGGPGGNSVVVNPPVCTAPDGTQFTEFSDPNKETFILRIGKKSEGIDKKNNLELELQTPKGPPLKPIPKMETVETQYDPIDVGPEDVSSGGASQKKPKGGKKGKKK